MKKVIIAVVCICLLAGTLYCAFLQNPNPKEIIGIIGAMDNEVDTLKKAADIKNSTKIADMDFMEGKIGDKKVVIVKCGMGKVNAAVCAHTLIHHFRCTEIINTGDLIEALRQNELYAALDVFEEEPLDKNSPLWSMENVMITPHNSFVSDKTANRLSELIMERLNDFSGGKHD